MIPLVFFLFGITSSLHCVGMCGPLSLLASNGKQSSWFYQTGRLTGYLSIGTILSFVGQAALKTLLVKIGLGFWYFLALVIAIGIIYFLVSKINFNTPKFIENISKQITLHALSQRNQSRKAFLIGLSSVFLPCGILYLALISLVALNGPLLAFAGIVFFWLGTLPLLHFGLPWVRHIISRSPIKKYHLNFILIIALSALVLIHRYPVFAPHHHCH
jgi:sulfite exporter TauE/SafE